MARNKGPYHWKLEEICCFTTEKRFFCTGCDPWYGLASPTALDQSQHEKLITWWKLGGWVCVTCVFFLTVLRTVGPLNFLFSNWSSLSVFEECWGIASFINLSLCSKTRWKFLKFSALTELVCERYKTWTVETETSVRLFSSMAWYDYNIPAAGAFTQTRNIHR